MTNKDIKEKSFPESCDAVIIGAGIGGLVCANYLAKSGLHVVLVEKHHTPGGLCSSFRTGGFYFDAGAHYLGSCRPEGQIGKLLNDLDVVNRLPMIRCEPSDVVISKNHEQLIFSNPDKLIDSFSTTFSSEAIAFKRFIRYVQQEDPLKLYIDLKHRTFKEVLDSYFKSWELKSILSTLLGNIGLPSSQASALTSLFLFREFILDGGYYPKGGMQAFPNVLLERFIEYGGEALFLTNVEQIQLSGSGNIEGVKVRIKGRHSHVIRTKQVIANCDPYQVFRTLLAGQIAPNLIDLDTRDVTISAFMVHLGIERDIAASSKYRCNLWSYKRGHIDEYYSSVIRGEIDHGLDSFIFCSVPSFHDPDLLPAGLHSVQLITAAPYADRSVWADRKEQLAEEVIDRIEQFIPDIRQGIRVKRIATPSTIVKYTANYRGAMYGWASTPEQMANSRFGESSLIDGLHFAGHWAGVPSGHSGVPTVVTSGRNTARLVLRNLGKSTRSFAVNGINSTLK